MGLTAAGFGPPPRVFQVAPPGSLTVRFFGIRYGGSPHCDFRRNVLSNCLRSRVVVVVCRHVERLTSSDIISNPALLKAWCCTHRVGAPVPASYATCQIVCPSATAARGPQLSHVRAKHNDNKHLDKSRYASHPRHSDERWVARGVLYCRSDLCMYMFIVCAEQGRRPGQHNAGGVGVGEEVSQGQISLTR